MKVDADRLSSEMGRADQPSIMKESEKRRLEDQKKKVGLSLDFDDMYEMKDETRLSRRPMEKKTRSEIKENKKKDITC